MDSVRVVINGVEVGSFNPSDMGMAVTYQTKAIDEIGGFRINFTKSLRLPLTDALNKALRNPTEIDLVDAVSLRERVSIRVYVNEATSVDGWLKPIRFIVTQTIDIVEFSVEPRERLWVDDLDSFNMTDLDFTIAPDQSHTLTVSNIRTSETYLPLTREYVYAPTDIAEVSRMPILWVEQLPGTTGIFKFYYLGEQLTGTIVINSYGFENTSLNLVYETCTNSADAFWNGRGIYVIQTTTAFSPTTVYAQTGYLYKTEHTWQCGDFYPYIRIDALLQRMFKRIGWQVEYPDSSLFLHTNGGTTEESGYYHFQHNIEILNKFEEPRNKFKVKVYDGGYKFTRNVADFWIMPFYESTADGYISNLKYTDVDNDVSATVDSAGNVSRYTATEATILRFNWEYHFLYEAATLITGVDYNDIRLTIKQYNGISTLRRTIVSETLTIKKNTSTKAEFKGKLQSSFVYMESGDFIQCEIAFLASFSLMLVDITIFDDNVFESFMYSGGNFKGKSIRLNEYLPEVTGKEWIKDWSNINNIQFYTNEQLKTVYIVPDQLKRTGKRVDFKAKINRLKDIELEDICGLHPKYYYFNWKKDENDWAVDFIEITSEERFATGTLTNENVFTTEEQNVDMKIYAATLDKFELSNIMYFNTVEMKGIDTWSSPVRFKRTDYEPRYLRLIFGEVLEDNGLTYNGGISATAYSIEGDATPLTYVRPEFQTALHFSSLLTTWYERMIRRINYGQIVRAYLNINDKDIDNIATILSADNDFRADYQIQLKDNEQEAEMYKIEDYSPANQEETKVEFIIFKDNY